MGRALPCACAHVLLLALVCTTTPSALAASGAAGLDAEDAAALEEDDIWGVGAEDPEGVVSEALVTVRPGFSKTGHRVSHKHGEAECSMSYSSFGSYEEQWKIIITETRFRWTCTIEGPRSPSMKFTFYQVLLTGGKGLPVLEDVEVWGQSGVLVREEHFVIPQGLSVRNAGGWTNPVQRITVSRKRPDALL